MERTASCISFHHPTVNKEGRSGRGARVPSEQRTTGHANWINSGGHMIFLKNKILIHSHSLLFTRGVCFFSPGLFQVRQVCGEGRVGAQSQLGGRGTNRARKGPPPSYQTRKEPGLGPAICSGANPFPSPGLCPNSGSDLLDSPFQSKVFLFFTFGFLFLNVL